MRDVGSPLRKLRRWAPHLVLWLAGAAQPPLFRSAVPLAVVSTLVLVILWPYLREFGLAVSMMISEGVVSGWPILTAIPNILTDHGRQWRVCRWEAWAMLRWWLLFGAWATLWLIASWPLQTRCKLEPPADCYRRFFAFAPWIVLLELLFLVGVWIDSHNTVPEPSTGFVEGIFSWDLCALGLLEGRGLDHPRLAANLDHRVDLCPLRPSLALGTGRSIRRLRRPHRARPVRRLDCLVKPRTAVKAPCKFRKAKIGMNICCHFNRLTP